MGCDIHASIEYHPWDTRPLPNYSRFAEIHYLPRSYHVFSAMAGVRRNEAEPVAPPRGIPDDADYGVREEAHGPDWHSHSWLTADEFEEALRRADKVRPQGVKSEYRAVLTLMRQLGASARLVFWFDN